MAYESLKTLIRQYIKPNDNEEITGAVMQAVLLAMIDDMGASGSYLALTGGNLTGSTTVSSNPTATSRDMLRLAQDGLTVEYVTGSGLNESLLLTKNSLVYSANYPSETAQQMAVNFGFTGVTVGGGITASSFVNSAVNASVRGNYLLKADGDVLDATTLATKTWVEQNFITVSFFDSLFKLYNDVTLLPANSTLPIDQSALNIKAMFGFWTEQYISALGQGSGGSGGGVDMAAVWSALAAATSEQINISHLATALSGYALTSQIPTNNNELTNGAGYITITALNGYATQSWVTNTALSGYALSSEIPTNNNQLTNGAGYITASALVGYATETWVGQNYLGINANAASATKLATARTLWGQSFDGTANVTGAMSSVPSIDSLMYFDTTNGRVGIGTSSPSYALEVTGSEYVSGEVRIGNIRLVYDSTNNAIKVVGLNDAAANFYATGGVSALGYGSGGSGGGVDMDAVWSALAGATSEQINASHLSTALTSALAGYLPLTGGTLTGELLVADTTNITASITNGTVELTNIVSSRIVWGLTLSVVSGANPIEVGRNGTALAGLDSDDFFFGNGFKATGSSDSYVLLGGGGTSQLKTINGNSLFGSGDITISGGGNYLPLTGGTLSGSLYFNSNVSIQSTTNGRDVGSVFINGTDYVFGLMMGYGQVNRGIWGQTEDSWLLYFDESNTILNYGNVGIGATSPAYKLDVDGYGQATGWIKSGSNNNYVLLGGGGHSLMKTVNGNSLFGSGNIVIQGGGGSGGPYDAEVEYLESTGTQYIDTGYTFSGTSKREFKVVFLSTGYYTFCYGANSSSNEVLLSTNTSSYLNGTTYNAGIALNSLYEITIDCTTGAASSVINGVTKGTSQSSPNNGAELLFAGHNLGNMKWRLYYYKIYNNNVLVRDFIPVRVGTTGYMYDKVSGQLFGNAGSGSFTLGSDVTVSYLPTSGGTLTGDLTINNANLKIYGSGDDGHANISVDVDGLYISAINTAGRNVYLSPDVYVSNNIDIDGECRAASFVNTSDLRKKNIMSDVPMNIYNVANAPLFKFTWNNERKATGLHIGSAAQYWQTVLPELVSVGKDEMGTLAMQYDVIALASAITVAKEVVDHERRIILLEKENEALRKELEELKTA